MVSALRWIESVLGNGAKVQAVTLLAGATSSAVYGVEVQGRAELLPLVLRLYDNAEWLASEPDLARHEAWGLGKAANAEVPTPELIAFDETGQHCGLPAVLMTRLAGRVELLPKDHNHWLQGMAQAIAPVHQIKAEEALWSYAPYNDLAKLQEPEWSAHPKNWARAIEIVQGAEPICPKHFIHRDYHPNNVLWAGEQVSGIVDWPNCCRGPAGIDVAWCRQNLAQLHGISAANAFLSCYQTVDSAFCYDPYWDLLGIIEFLPEPPRVYPGWPALGVTMLTDALIQQRLENYLASILAYC